MGEKWIGKSVSIHCRGDIGIFQGIIKQATPTEIVITKAVRNGIPLKKTVVEVTLTVRDIEKLELISCTNVPNVIPSKMGASLGTANASVAVEEQFEQLKLNNGRVQQQQPPQANSSRSPPPDGKSKLAKPTSKSPGPGKFVNGQQKKGTENGTIGPSVSRPIDINGAKSNDGILPLDGSAKKTKPCRFKKSLAKKMATFGSPDDDPMIMSEEFDFEKNLALFDKQAIWDEIDAIQNTDVLRQPQRSATKKKYRHDENVLASEPAQYRQIKIESTLFATAAAQEYQTDEGLIIPSIPRSMRNLIQQLAENHGLAMERQNDMLARGATEMALQLLGGSRRLTPNNQHQWPKIVIICDEPHNARLSEIGISTGRQLACHGLKVVVYVSCATQSTRTSHELELYAATGSLFTYNVNTLPSSDLVIAAVKQRELSAQLRKWITDNRAPVLAIDPPWAGIDEVPIKCSILPILPLNDIAEDTCGRLYLCNLGIPDKFFTDSGIKYKSPFDKVVIPIHRRKD